MQRHETLCFATTGSLFYLTRPQLTTIQTGDLALMPAAEVHHATIVILAASTAHVMSVDDMRSRIGSLLATIARQR